MSAADNLKGFMALFALPYYAARRRKEQWLSPAQLADLRAERVRALFRKARAAPYYKRVLPDGSRACTAEELLAGAPILDKRILAEEGLEALLTAGSAGLIPIMTSGSTGHPARLARGPLEETEYSARVHRVYSAYGSKARDRILNVGSLAAKRRTGAATALRDLGLLPKVQQIFVGMPVHQAVRILLDFKPQLVTGYAVGLENMAEYIVRHGIELTPPRVVTCGAMDVTDHCRDLIQRAFRAPAMNVYVCNELGVVGWECPGRRGLLHTNDDVQVIEILDENDEPVPDGTPGEIVVTSLTLTRMPLIRYRTGDTAARVSQPCSCGRGLGLMTPVLGRTAHTIVGPGGELYAAPTVGSIFKAARAYEWVRRFQVREQEGRELLILVEIHCEPSPAQRQDLLDQMHRIFGPAFTFRIEVRDELPLTPAGKYQFLVPLSRNN